MADMSDNKPTTTMKLLTNLDVVSHTIMRPALHPELPAEYKETYDVLEHVLDSGESYYTPTQLFLHVDSEKSTLTEQFAQLLEHRLDLDDYLVVYRSGPPTLEARELIVDKYDNYQLARYNYEKVTDSIHAAMNREHIFRYVLEEFISLEPPNLGLEEEAAPSVAGRDYARYEDLDAGSKQLIQLIICDFAKTDTCKWLRGDVSKSVVGYPTLPGLGEAFGSLNMLHSYYKGKITFNETGSPAHLCNLFRVCIPCCVEPESGRLPAIDSMAKVQENGEVVRALHSKTFRQELALEYPVKVDLYLSRLAYPIERLEPHSAGIWSDVHRCVANTGRSCAQPVQPEVVNVFAFDTSATPAAAYSNCMLLWHGTYRGNIYSILGSGMHISSSTENNMFGNGIYFSDTVAKAVMFCDPRREETDMILLLCEVKLGRSKVLHWAQEQLKAAPDGYHSVKGLGYFQAAKNEAPRTDQYGASFQVDKLERQEPIVRRSLLYNEYVVYTSEQVKVRYLVHVKLPFPPKRHTRQPTGGSDAGADHDGVAQQAGNDDVAQHDDGSEAKVCDDGDHDGKEAADSDVAAPPPQ